MDVGRKTATLKWVWVRPHYNGSNKTKVITQWIFVSGRRRGLRENWCDDFNVFSIALTSDQKMWKTRVQQNRLNKKKLFFRGEISIGFTDPIYTAYVMKIETRLPTPRNCDHN